MTFEQPKNRPSKTIACSRLRPFSASPISFSDSFQRMPIHTASNQPESTTKPLQNWGSWRFCLGKLEVFLLANHKTMADLGEFEVFSRDKSCFWQLGYSWVKANNCHVGSLSPLPGRESCKFTKVISFAGIMPEIDLSHSTLV